jgi:hypothetical protein
MSIYLVPIKEWYYDKESAYHEELGILKALSPLHCSECKKEVNHETGYVMHSITFGGPDSAMCKKCSDKD